MAVVVQQMVDAELSGVMFTRDPVTGDPSRLSITASYGLGEVCDLGEARRRVGRKMIIWFLGS